TEPAPRGLALSPDESRLYATHFFTGRVSVIDTRTLTIQTTLSTGSDSNLSQSMVLDSSSALAFLPQTRSNTGNRALLFASTICQIVSILDRRTGENLLRSRIAIDITDRPVSLPLDAVVTSLGRLYVVNAGSNDLSVIDLPGTLVAHISVGANPRGIALTPDE